MEEPEEDAHPAQIISDNTAVAVGKKFRNFINMLLPGGC